MKQRDFNEILSEVKSKIASACERSGRKVEDVQIVAVTKTHGAEVVSEAWSAGLMIVGENKVQELLLKEPELNLVNCSAHLIGHLQSNKVKKIVGKVDTIQSVDTVDIAKEIGKRSVMQDIS